MQLIETFPCFSLLVIILLNPICITSHILESNENEVSEDDNEMNEAIIVLPDLSTKYGRNMAVKTLHEQPRENLKPKFFLRFRRYS